MRIDNGSTGRSANGLAPMYAADGRMIGEVSVGLRESSVSVALWHVLPAYAGWFAIALGAGAGASWLLARRLKSRTFGLELDEIAQLLQEREATLHGIREGVVAFDRSGRVTMVNDEARRLLGLGTLPSVAGWTTWCRAGAAARRALRRDPRAGRGRAHRRLLPDGEPHAGRAGR